MNVFLFDQKLISVINRKEEITEETCLITDQEMEKIQETLDNEGFFWRIDKYTVGASGKQPTEDSRWDDKNHTWYICEKAKQERIEKERAQVWRSIKVKRLASSYTGVKVGEHWYHTTIEARNRYDELARAAMLDMWEDQEWRTMGGEMVLLTLPLFKELMQAINEKSKHDFNNAEHLYDVLYKTENAYSVDILSGWSESYDG